MKFTIARDRLLKALQLATGVVERRQTLPVLANLLIKANETGVALTGTDLEVEIVAHTDVCLLYTSPSPRDREKSRMPSSA